VVQVTVTPFSHCLHTATHWSNIFGLKVGNTFRAHASLGPGGASASLQAETMRAMAIARANLRMTRHSRCLLAGYYEVERRLPTIKRITLPILWHASTTLSTLRTGAEEAVSGAGRPFPALEPSRDLRARPF